MHTIETGYQSLDLSDIFEMGSTIEYLKRAATIKTRVKGEKYILSNFKALKGYFEKYDLDTTELTDWIKRLDKDYSEEDEITENDALELKNDANRWIKEMWRILSSRRVLDITKTGALNQEALIHLSDEKSSAFFDENIWTKLSEIEKSDFSNAAKCLLAGIPTPAVIIALRGAEAAVKKYCEFKTCGSAEKKQWGPIVEELKTRAKELNIRDSFLGFLDYIRDAKRNFAAHPNKIYTQREAELIFMQVINLVQDTYKEIIQSSK